MTLYFYSHDSQEPPHVHVGRDQQSAKFWLDPISLSRNLGFGAPELRRLHRLVVQNRARLLESWHAHFDT